MRDKYELQLKQLNDLMIHMGSLIEAAIEMAIEALVKGDADKAREAVEFDDTIDQTQKDIESLCMRILLMQQPVATDLRFVSTALKLVTDMERIGDQATDITEIMLTYQKLQFHLSDPNMSRIWMSSRKWQQKPAVW